jgi:hypothetical protein
VRSVIHSSKVQAQLFRHNCSGTTVQAQLRMLRKERSAPPLLFHDSSTSQLCRQRLLGFNSVNSSIAMRPISRIVPLLRQASPRLSENFFTCRASSARPSNTKFLPRNRSAPFFQAVRFQSTVAGLPHSAGPAVDTIQSVAKARSFPKTSDSSVAYWLLGSAASVFGIVIFGGLTRLTESG